jgi:hypothetical protein
MKPNFNSPLLLDNDNRRVDAAGPFNWEGATGQCEVAVTITQSLNGSTVVATGDSSSYNAPQPNWQADADTVDNKQLQPGSAIAEGVVTLTNPSRPPVRWSQPVELVGQS